MIDHLQVPRLQGIVGVVAQQAFTQAGVGKQLGVIDTVEPEPTLGALVGLADVDQ
ncbi:hypothetical protein D3C78_1891470 [compost metagenome]